MNVYGINMTSSYQYTFTLFSDSKPVVNTKQNKILLNLFLEMSIHCYCYMKKRKFVATLHHFTESIDTKKYLYIYSVNLYKNKTSKLY